MSKGNPAEDIGNTFIAINLAISAISIALHKTAPQTAAEAAAILEGHAAPHRESEHFAGVAKRLDSWQRELLGQSSTPLH